jgi:hypothetical protein
MKKNGAYTLSLLRAKNEFTFGLSRTCSRIFAAPDPAVVDIDLITDRKHAFIIENY